MAIMGLNLPTDVPWEQVCRTRDMMATKACQRRMPPKWHSSIAVSKYVPDDEYQVYPDRRITYLKITCSITGYQPRDLEVEGQINYSFMTVQTVNHMDSLLEKYLPCTGALIQVAVSPKAEGKDFDHYPYFMDFQPQKRELYEMVTDTGERSSRSSDSLSLGKASGTAQSLEVLDIDQGGSFSESTSGSYMGTGGSESLATSVQGQWGTKQLGSQQSSVSRSADASREKRETESHTTQLTQMYNLLDSYHKGTNRAVFYVQPRPHVLESPTGFVRGPRPVDGIQEFFLVVNEPKDSEGFVTSVRLDTAHLTVVPDMDYDHQDSEEISARAYADLPTRQDPPAPAEQTALRHDGDRVGTVYYNCYKRTAHDSTPYIPPSGWVIDVNNEGGYHDVINNASNGSSSVDVDPSGNSLSVVCDAESHVCQYDHHDIRFGYFAPGNVGQDISKWTAYAERTVRAHLRSQEKIKKVGDHTALLITTRGLCCGAEDPDEWSPRVHDAVILGADDKTLVVRNPQYQTVPMGVPGRAIRAIDLEATRPAPRPTEPTETETTATKRAARGEPRTMTARDANELANVIREAMIESAGSRRRDITNPVPYIESELFQEQLRCELAQTAEGATQLNRTTREFLDEEAIERLARLFGTTPEDVTCWQLSALPPREIADLAGTDLATATRLRLASLGIVITASPTTTD